MKPQPLRGVEAVIGSEVSVPSKFNTRPARKAFIQLREGKPFDAITFPFGSHPRFSLYPQKTHPRVGSFEIGIFAKLGSGGDHLEGVWVKDGKLLPRGESHDIAVTTILRENLTKSCSKNPTAASGAISVNDF